LIYAGGIRSVADAVAAVRAGADRVCIDALLHDDIAIAAELGGPLGAQAIIAALPLSSPTEWFEYRAGRNRAFPPQLLALLTSGAVSEALIIDHRHEGSAHAFDRSLVDLDLGLPLIAFGGISEVEQIASLLQRDNVVGVGIGNFLNYREHALQAYRAAIDGLLLRPPLYQRPLAIS
jgi:cyclase